MSAKYGYTKTKIAEALGFARGNFYYDSKLEAKDQELVKEISIWHETDDTLGHKKLGELIGTGKNRVKRVMKKYVFYALFVFKKSGT